MQVDNVHSANDISQQFILGNEGSKVQKQPVLIIKAKPACPIRKTHQIIDKTVYSWQPDDQSHKRGWSLKLSRKGPSVEAN